MQDFWPVKWPESVNTDEYEPETLGRAKSLAVSSLRALTLNRVGPVLVKAQPCAALTIGTYEGFRHRGQINPAGVHLLSCHCMSRTAQHHSSRVKLIAPVHEVLEVRINGRVLDPSTYDVVEGAYLIRYDDAYWPVCSGPDFTVDYTTGYPVPLEGQFVAGILAEEFLRGMKNPDRCRLPRGVTEVSRQGITISVEAGLFPDGLTGLPEVDAFIYQWNPNGLKTKPRVYSPDLPKSGASW